MKYLESHTQIVRQVAASTSCMWHEKVHPLNWVVHKANIAFSYSLCRPRERKNAHVFPSNALNIFKANAAWCVERITLFKEILILYAILGECGSKLPMWSRERMGGFARMGHGCKNWWGWDMNGKVWEDRAWMVGLVRMGHGWEELWG